MPLPMPLSMRLSLPTAQAPPGGRVPAPGRRFAAAVIAVLAAAALTGLALHQILFAAAALYAVGFLLVASRYPAVALMLIFASAPFQNDLSGGGGAKFSLAEVNLLLTLPILYMRGLVQKQRPRVGPVLIPVLLYFTVCVFSSMIHWLGQTALLSLFQMLLYFIIAVGVFYALAPEPRHYWPAFNGLVVVGVFLAIAGIATNYWFIGLNKNGIASSLTCCFLVGVEMLLSASSPRRRQLLSLALLVIVVGLLFSLSRGAWLGTLAGVFFIFAMRRRLALLLRISLFLLPLLLIFWFTLPPASREYAAGFGGDHYNIKLRYESISLAQHFFAQSPIYGMGVGLRKDYDATNVLLMTLAETGVLGLAALLLIHLTYFRMIWQAQKRIARSEALFSLLCVGGALVLDKFVHGMVDHYWSRGAIMAAWASAGMATRAYYVAADRSNPATSRSNPATSRSSAATGRVGTLSEDWPGLVEQGRAGGTRK